MSIVTISRGSYSRGKKIAEALAEELNYECISRDILLEASDQYNTDEIKLVKALHDAPSVLDRFTNGKQRYINYFKSAFLSHMTQGNVVYHGLAGHFFLQDIPHVLKVRINARMSDRVAEEMKRKKCSEEQALYNLQKDDEERRKWGLQLYGTDTWDSRLYDLVFCVDTLSINDIVEMLALTVRKEQYRETADSKFRLERRALIAQINARTNAISPHAKVVLKDKGTIELYNLDGRLRSDSVAREELAVKLKSEYNLNAVHYREPVEPYKGHINTFYNLDVH